MSYILNNWRCLNPECAKIFESSDKNPPCKYCKTMRTQWVPGGFAIGSAVTVSIDSNLRSLANTHKLTNLRSATLGEAAHPGVKQHKAEGMYNGIPWSPNGATAGFADVKVKHKVTVPRDGAKFKSAGPSAIPTVVKGRHEG